MMALQTEQLMPSFHLLKVRRKYELFITLIGGKDPLLFQVCSREPEDGDCSLTLIKLPRLVKSKSFLRYPRITILSLVHVKEKEQHAKENHSIVTLWEKYLIL